ncbi:MAG: hypothetical protein OHK0029_24020 [Armatimonadaceae bacterium]
MTGLATLALLSLISVGTVLPGAAQTGSDDPPKEPVQESPAEPKTDPQPAPATPAPTTPQKPKDGEKDPKNPPQKDPEDPQVSLVGANSKETPLPLGEVPPEQANQTQYVPKREMPLAERWFGRWGRGITISGMMTTRVQDNEVAGAQGGTNLFNEQVNNNNWDYRNVGGLQQRAQINIHGRILNAWDVNATLTNARGGTQFNQIFRFNYEKSGTHLDLGNINKSLAGNQFVNFQRNVQGIAIGRDFGRGRVKFEGFASLTRAVTQRGTLRGNGTPGPYFMNAAMLIPRSEVVRLNGEQLKPESDYQIDYVQGTISFLGGRIVNETDTVEFTYEAENFNTTPGLLSGMRWDFSGPGGGQYGITYIRQDATGQSTRNGDVIERFPVMADPRYRYQLSSLIDPNFPVVIRWFNRVLVENVDYVLNRNLRYFQLLTASLPPDTSLTGNASLQVTYRPVRQNSLAGDRSILGVDTQVRIPGNGTMAIHLGQSNGANPAQRGMAMAVRTTFNSSGRGDQNRWQASFGWLDMDSTFSTIDSVNGAFLQAEKGLTTDFSFSPNRFVSFTTGFDEKRVANRNFTLGSTTSADNLVWATQTNLRASASLNFPNLPQLTLRHQQAEQGSGVGSRNAFASTSLEAAWNIGSRLRFNGALTRTASQGRSIFASAFNNNVNSGGSQTGSTIIDQLQDSTSSITNSVATNARFSVGYIPFSWLTLNSELGFSRSESGASGSNSSNTSGFGSTARTLGFSMTMSPFQAWEGHWLQSLNLSAGLTDSENGQSTQNFYNPGSGGGGSIIPTNVSGQRVRATNLGLRYQPGDRLFVDYSFSRTLNLVPGFDNTQSGMQNVSLSYNANRWWVTTLTHSTANTTFVGGQGNSDSSTTSFTNTLGPFGRFEFSTALSRTRFDSATFYGNTGNSPTRQASIGNFNNFNNPGLPGGIGGGVTGISQAGTNTVLTFRTDYRFAQGRSIVAQWTSVDQASPVQSSGTGGSTGFRSATNYYQGIGSIGLDFQLMQIPGMTTSFGVFLNFNTMTDRDDSRYSYRARTVTAELTTRF